MIPNILNAPASSAGAAAVETAARLNAESDDGTSYRVRIGAKGRNFIDVFDADGSFIFTL